MTATMAAFAGFRSCRLIEPEDSFGAEQVTLTLALMTPPPRGSGGPFGTEPVQGCRARLRGCVAALPANPATACQEFAVVLRFQALESVQHWLKSPERSRMLTKVTNPKERSRMLAKVTNPKERSRMLTKVTNPKERARMLTKVTNPKERSRMLAKVVRQYCRARMLPANPFQLLTQVEPLLTSKSSAVATRSRRLPDAFTDLLVQVGAVVSRLAERSPPRPLAHSTVTPQCPLAHSTVAPQCPLAHSSAHAAHSKHLGRASDAFAAPTANHEPCPRSQSGTSAPPRPPAKWKVLPDTRHCSCRRRCCC
jgi:hypothetical protein